MQRGHTLFLAGPLRRLRGLDVRGNDLGSNTGSAMWGVVFGFRCLRWDWDSSLPPASAETRAAQVRVPGAETAAALAFSLYLTHKESDTW